MALIDKDSAALQRKYLPALNYLKQPTKRKPPRSAAIQKATKQAALVPLEVARKALDMMSVIADVARLGNRNAVTDACVAMMSARTAVLGALLNVRINPRFAQRQRFCPPAANRSRCHRANRLSERKRFVGCRKSRPARMSKNVYHIGSGALTFEIIERIINENLKLELAPEAKLRIQKCRDYLDHKIASSEEPLYGITTGFGSLCTKNISSGELGTLQENPDKEPCLQCRRRNPSCHHQTDDAAQGACTFIGAQRRAGHYRTAHPRLLQQRRDAYCLRPRLLGSIGRPCSACQSFPASYRCG